MATYFKYAERSADSQVDWAEIGKNMTDMLREENRLREDKKAAIDESTRKYAEELSNAPQGEHVGAREEALRFADDASKYMLMQERLLKQGLLNPRDYMIARQNLVDGTKKAFGSMKAFQTSYAELMERAKTDVSSAIELKRLETVQGYGNFRESGFFIDAPTGGVNVGLKEYQDLDGKKVMGLKQGSTRGMQYIDGAIYGRVDKFKYLAPLKALSDTYGEEIRVSIDPATMSKLGSITSITDLRLREDIDPDTKKVLFHYMTAVTDAVNGLMANPLQRGSLLIDTMGYDWTDDPEEAAKNPRLVLEVIDPNTGKGELKFTEEQEQASTDFMVQQFLGMVDRKQEAKTTSQVQRQDPPQSVLDAETKKREAENFGRNLGKALKSTNIEERDNAIKYLGQKAGRQVIISGGRIIVRDIDGQGESVYDLNANPDELASSLVSAFGVDLPEDTILKFAKSTLRGNNTNRTGETTAIVTRPAEVVFEVPENIFTDKSVKSAANLQNLLPSGFTVVDKGFGVFGNNVHVYAPGESEEEGDTPYKYNANLDASEIPAAKAGLEAFINKAKQGEGAFADF
jgi:hypothetical protein